MYCTDVLLYHMGLYDSISYVRCVRGLKMQNVVYNEFEYIKHE